MRIFIPFLAAVITVIFLACGNGVSSNGGFGSSTGGQDSFLTSNESAAFATPAPAATAAPAAAFAVGAPGPAGEPSPFAGDDRSSGSALQTAQRKIISSASVSLQVEVVDNAIDQVRSIAEGVGGFFEQLSSSGEPGHERANITVPCPKRTFWTP